MDKETEIANYLRDTYKPDAIILHGSRAVDMGRPHSDWDFFLLFTGTPVKSFQREEIAGEDVEWKGIRVPISENELLDTFGVQLQFGKVLWEEGDSGSRLLQAASDFYAKGVVVSDDERRRFKQFMLHKIHGMEDDIETSYMFLRHVSVLFDRSVNWWMELHGQYRKPFYIAVPQIQKEDSEYYQLLMTLCGDGPNAEKIHAAKSIVSHLFAAPPKT